MAEGGLSDDELLKRLSSLYSEAFIAGVAKELMDARTAVYASEEGMSAAVDAIHKRFSYRMHDLAEFMKGLLQRFCPRSAHAMQSPISSSGNGFLDVRYRSRGIPSGSTARTRARGRYGRIDSRA